VKESMTILGIETSTEVCSVAVVDDEGNVTEESLVEAHIHSEKILTLLNNVIKRAEMRLADLSAIAVSIGPGSFTGLRIGLSTAKGLCYALEKPLVTVPTFDAIAQSALALEHKVNEVVILIDARQGEFYSQRFSRNDGRMVAMNDVSVQSLADSLDALSKDAVVVTDAQVIMQRGKSIGVRCVDAKKIVNARVVAELGKREFLAKEFVDIADIEPKYLKDFVVKKSAAR
jgi:tRNA threonylcarbamoyladenosine biosynthesis protein TsaB